MKRFMPTNINQPPSIAARTQQSQLPLGTNTLML